MNILRRLGRIIAIGPFALALFLGFQIVTTAPAIADTILLPQSPLAVSSLQDLDNRAKSDVDKVAGSGTSDQLEGSVQQAKGTLKRQVGQSANQVEGAADQIQGRAQSDIGRVKGAAEDAGEAAEDAGENLIDNFKNFIDR